MSSAVYRSAVASLAAQMLIGAVTSVGFFLPSPQDGRPAGDFQIILGLELGSQVIELAWYLVVVCRSRQITTWTRYLDWVVSTPIMLLSTGMFFHYRQMRPVLDVFRSSNTYFMLGFNWLMLGFGFAMERGALPAGPSLLLGGASLVGSFTFLARLMRDDPADAVSVWLFFVVYAVWGLYGVAAAFPSDSKNVAYNGLDVVSKNCFGLFLFVYLLAA